MRNLYREFFYVPENGKVRDKVMLTRVAVTVISIVICLASMGITAYAYFSYNVASEINVIKAANLETSVQITDSNGEVVKVITSNYKSHLASLKGGAEYHVTIKPTARSTAKTGFVIITADGCMNRYHTQQIGQDGDANTPSIAFSLILGADAEVTFLAHWGTSSYYGYESANNDLYVTHGETFIIPVNGKVPGGNTESSTPSAEQTHTVAVGENLTKIANLYGTTPERIAAYNKISDPNTIRPGSTVKIPPADWVLPAGYEMQTTKPAETTPPTTTTKPPVTTSVPATSESTPPADKTETTPEAGESESKETTSTETTPEEETNS